MDCHNYKLHPTDANVQITNEVQYGGSQMKNLRFGPPPTTDTWQASLSLKAKEKGRIMLFSVSVSRYCKNSYWRDKLVFSVHPSVEISGVCREMAWDIHKTFSGCIDLPGSYGFCTFKDVWCT